MISLLDRVTLHFDWNNNFDWNSNGDGYTVFSYSVWIACWIWKRLSLLFNIWRVFLLINVNARLSVVSFCIWSLTLSPKMLVIYCNLLLFALSVLKICIDSDSCGCCLICCSRFPPPPPPPHTHTHTTSFCSLLHLISKSFQFIPITWNTFSRLPILLVALSSPLRKQAGVGSWSALYVWK